MGAGAGMSGPPALVHLVRHGHVRNPRKVVYGRLPDFRLSEDGERQARAAARQLALRPRPLARVYSSPLERARDTAALIAEATGAPVELDEDLVETDIGEAWLGRPWAEVRTRRLGQWLAYLHRPHEVDFMGETFAAAGERVARAVRRIAARHPGHEVAAVSHGDPIKAGVLTLTGGDIRHLHHSPVPTGGIVTVEVGEGPARIVARWAPARERVDARGART